jgi:hypothetical protein
VRFPQLKGKCQGKTRKDGARSALFQISCYLFFSVVICAVLLLFMLLYVLFVCKCVLLPPADNPIAVNKYIISLSLIFTFLNSKLKDKIFCTPLQLLQPEFGRLLIL